MFVGGGGKLEVVVVVASEREAGESFLDFDEDEDPVAAFGFCFGLSSLVPFVRNCCPLLGREISERFGDCVPVETRRL